MASVFDVANWLLSKDSLPPKKLQKLCYYVKAWGLALLNEEIFPEPFQAWVHGPVCPVLYTQYRDFGWSDIAKIEKEPTCFNEKQLEVLNAVWGAYSELDGNQLEELTHREDPWRITRQDLPLSIPSTRIIDNDLMRTYYLSLYQRSQSD